MAKELACNYHKHPQSPSITSQLTRALITHGVMGFVMGLNAFLTVPPIYQSYGLGW